MLVWLSSGDSGQGLCGKRFHSGILRAPVLGCGNKAKEVPAKLSLLGEREAGHLCCRNCCPGLGLPKYSVLLGLGAPPYLWNACMAEELSVFQVVEQESARGRSEQALLGLRSVGKVGSSKYIIYSWILRGSGQAKFCYPPSNQERYSWREREKEKHTLL